MKQEVVVIIFPNEAEGGQSYIQLPWRKGKRLRQYLRDPALRRYHLLGMFIRSRTVGNTGQEVRRLRYTSELKAGETVRITPISKAVH